MGRTGSDAVQTVSQHVGEHHGKKAGGLDKAGEPAALDRRESLPDRVDLHDVGAAGKKLVRHRHEILQGHTVPGLFKKGGTSPRHEKEHRVPFRKMFH